MAHSIIVMLQFSKWLAAGIIYLALYFCAGSTGVEAQELKISNSMSSHICGQHEKHQESGSIQDPVKDRPENDDAKCGWLKWAKCEKDGADCPAFTFESCSDSDEPKRGRSAMPNAEDVCPKPNYSGWSEVSPPNKYPSLVAIHRGMGCYVRACWGAILNAEWVVVPQTSGCFASFSPEQPEDFHVIAGDRIVYEDEGTEQKRKIAQFIPHPEFKFNSYKHYRANLGLVRLEKPFEFNEDVQPMDLAAIKNISSSSGAPLENLHVATWVEGKVNTNDSLNLARQFEFPVDFVPDSECYDEIMEDDGAVKESLICAGKCPVSGNGIDPGPRQGFIFTVAEGGGAPIPLGIGPVRQSNFNKTGPFGVYTDLSFYMPWIEDTIKKQKGRKVNVKGQVRGQGRSGQSGRLAGSSDSPPHKYPSMINLWSNSTSQCQQHSCGGVILSPHWILTASHCLEEPAEKYKIIVGDHDQSKDEGTEQVVLVDKIIRHESWAAERPKNDIGLIKVSTPIKYTDKIQPVKLPEPDFDTEGPAQAIGWGLHDGYIPYILQEVEMPIIPMDECIAIVNSTGRPVSPDKNRTICVGTKEKQICPGDSGGPLFIEDEGGEQIVIGVLSYFPRGEDLCEISRAEGSRAGSTNKVRPGIYTRVSYYIDWINKNSDFS